MQLSTYLSLESFSCNIHKMKTTVQGHKQMKLGQMKIEQIKMKQMKTEQMKIEQIKMKQTMIWGAEAQWQLLKSLSQNMAAKESSTKYLLPTTVSLVRQVIFCHETANFEVDILRRKTY